MSAGTDSEAKAGESAREHRRRAWLSDRRYDRNLAWALSWIAYASYYLGRKGFSVAKKTLSDRFGISESALGGIDTAYLSAYALGQFVSGWMGDRIGARRLIGFGMLLSAGMCFAFGSSSGALLFGVFFCINGFAQSSGWPGTTRAMAEWTTRENRGTVMAFWATCYQVGGIVATALAGKLLSVYGWRASFFGPAIWIVLVALAVLFLLRPGPLQLADGASVEVVAEDRRQRRAAQREVVKNLVLWCYGASYFFIKFIRYALLFWLPYYLAKKLGYSVEDAAYLSTFFEIGGILGVIGIGIASDRLKRFSRSLLAAIWLCGLSLALLAYTQLASAGSVANGACLAAVGALLFGPDSLISGAAAQDAGGPHAAAMATGFVNGMGSVGAMLEGIFVPAISKRYGWQSVFWLFVALAVLSAAALVPTLRRAPAPRAHG